MAKAGRKRKPGPREPSGKAQRVPAAVQEKRMKSVALEARERVFGVSPAFAERMPETSFLGRLVASGDISSRQLEAANEYRSVVEEYDRLHSMRGYPRAGDLNKSFGHDNTDPYSTKERNAAAYASRRYLDCEGALLQTRSVDHHAATVTRNVVLKDYWNPAHIPSLRVGLNALAHALGIPLNSGRVREVA